VTAYSLKQLVAEKRPDGSDRRSFPSGHAMFAFAGATMLCHEFGQLSPWVPIGGFGVATLTAVDRLVRDRHYLHDICAGAAIGFLSTELTYYVCDRLFPRRNATLAFTGQSVDFALRW
jgi:membrane-associated phospholipid phosphatase